MKKHLGLKCTCLMLYSIQQLCVFVYVCVNCVSIFVFIVCVVFVPHNLLVFDLTDKINQKFCTQLFWFDFCLCPINFVGFSYHRSSHFEMHAIFTNNKLYVYVKYELYTVTVFLLRAKTCEINFFEWEWKFADVLFYESHLRRSFSFDFFSICFSLSNDSIFNCEINSLLRSWLSIFVLLSEKQIKCKDGSKDEREEERKVKKRMEKQSKKRYGCQIQFQR